MDIVHHMLPRVWLCIQSREMRLEYPAYVCGGDSGGSYTFRLEQQLYRAVWEPYAESLAGEMAPAHVAHPGGKAGIATFRKEMSPGCKERIPQILQTCRSHMAFQEAEKPGIGRLTEI